MNTRKLIRMAAAARVLGGVLASRAGHRGTRIAATRLRQAWAVRRSWTGRHPLVAGLGAVGVGIVAFMVLSVVLGAVVVLLGALLKVALAVAVGVWAYRKFKPAQRGLEVVIVPPSPSRTHHG